MTVRAYTAMLLVSALALLVAPARAGESARGAGARAPRAVDLLNESVVFYASFDGERLDADLAVGRGEPVAVDGQARFVEGRFGRALLLGSGGGGARVTYAAADHLELGRPGALSFWIRPHSWTPTTEARRGYARFLGVVSGRASFVVQRMGFDRALRREDSLIIGAFDLPGTPRSYLVPAHTESWQPRDWHLVVVNWDRWGFEASLDGAPFERSEIPAGFGAEPFLAGGIPVPFVVGSRVSETSAIDELAIYAHPLEAEDVSRLFAQ